MCVEDDGPSSIQLFKDGDTSIHFCNGSTSEGCLGSCLNEEIKVSWKRIYKKFRRLCHKYDKRVMDLGTDRISCTRYL